MTVRVIVKSLTRMEDDQEVLIPPTTNDDTETTKDCCDPRTTVYRFIGLVLMCLLGFGKLPSFFFKKHNPQTDEEVGQTSSKCERRLLPVLPLLNKWKNVSRDGTPLDT